MEIFNLIGNICSVLGLLIAIFLTGQIIIIRKNINDNSISSIHQKGIITNGGSVAGRDIIS